MSLVEMVPFAQTLLEQLQMAESDAALYVAAGLVSCLLAGIVSMAYLFKVVINVKVGPPTMLPIEDFVEIPLIRKYVLSHDVVKFVFALPDSKSVLGLPTGQHITLKYLDENDDGKAVQRSYTPVSDNHMLGEVHLVIKVYRPNDKFPKGGRMSQHLDSLGIGDTILMKGPKGHMEWKGYGKFTTKPLGKPLEQRSSRNIGMLAGGTGITPMLQILHAIFRDTKDTTTKISLIYANQTEDDILVRDELETLQKEFPDRFQLWYTIDRSTSPEWKYDVGFMNKDMFEKHLNLDKKKDMQFFMCGPPPMIKFACLPGLKELGYSEKDWVVF